MYFRMLLSDTRRSFVLFHLWNCDTNQIVGSTFCSFPTLHFRFLCMADSLNKTAIEVKYNIKISDDPKYGNFDLTDIVTIKDMLTYTADAAIDECKFRDITGNELIEFWDRKQCKSAMNIKKYVQQYICYQLNIKSQISTSFRAIQASLRYERVLFDIRFSEELSNFQKIRLTLSDSGYPYMSQAYSPSFYKV